MSRSEAIDGVVKLGANVASSASKATDIVVVRENPAQKQRKQLRLNWEYGRNSG